MKSFIYDQVVLTDHELEQVLGGAETVVVPDEVKLLLRQREEQIVIREDIENVKRWAPWANDPVSTTLIHIQAGERLNEIHKQLNEYGRKLEIQREREAELRDLRDEEQEAQEAEEEEWLKEADAELAEQDAAPSNQGGGDAGVPANAEGPRETLPAIPSNLVNPPPTHTPEIIIEPVGDAEVHW